MKTLLLLLSQVIIAGAVSLWVHNRNTMEAVEQGIAIRSCALAAKAKQTTPLYVERGTASYSGTARMPQASLILRPKASTDATTYGALCMWVGDHSTMKPPSSVEISALPFSDE